LEVGTGDALTQSPLRIDEHVLHHLAGVHHPDERLAGLVERSAPVEDVVPSHAEIAAQIAAAWRRAAAAGVPFPVVELLGQERAVAAHACAALGLDLDVLRAPAIAVGVDEVAMRRLLVRAAILNRGALLVDGDDLDAADAARKGAVARLVERYPGPLFVAS